MPLPSSASPLTPDQSVRSTDLDALLSRSYAASLSYFSDPFSALFLPPSLRRSLSSAEKRPPLISIGTHARCWAVDTLVGQFLSSSHDVQVLSIGAGTDSRFWRMRKECEERGKKWNSKTWMEVDFEEATAGKARVVSTKEEFRKWLGGEHKIEKGGTALISPLYSLIPHDLRTPLSSLPSLDPSLPTLLLAECVMIYLSPETNNEILGWFSRTFATGVYVGYDPFGFEDGYGKQMVKNLMTRNLSLPSASSTPTLASLTSRLLSNGFTSAHALSIYDIRASVIPPAEIERVKQIERIDEVEELDLVLKHYAICWGSVSHEGTDRVELVKRA